MKCRLVDADGPLARLKKAIFNPELYENIAEWIVVCTLPGLTVWTCGGLTCDPGIDPVCVSPPGPLVGGAADGHRPHHADGGLHQDLQRADAQQQPQAPAAQAPPR